MPRVKIQSEYRIGEGFRINPAEAPILGRALEKLEKRLRHPVSAADVLEAAQDPRSPFHHHFDWDDTTAAVRYRLVQAQYLMRSLHVVLPEYDGVMVSALVPAGDHQFMRTAVAMISRPDLMDIWIKRLRAESQRISEEYVILMFLQSSSEEARDFVRAAQRLAATG